jgi:hypothetical protein
MPIELLSDVIEYLADQAGVYGAHDETCQENHICRVCWTANVRDRIQAAAELQQPHEQPIDYFWLGLGILAFWVAVFEWR